MKLGFYSILMLVLIMAAWASPAGATLLGTYTFNGFDPQGDLSVPTYVGLTYNPLTRVKLSSSPADDVFETTGWTTSTSADLSEYISLKVFLSSEYRARLGSLSFSIQGSEDGPERFAVRQSGDNFASRLQFTPTTSSMQTLVWNFSDISLEPSQSAEFRFYGWRAGNDWGTTRLDNVFIDGQVFAAPEPLTVLAVLVGAALIVRYLRNRIVEERKSQRVKAV